MYYTPNIQNSERLTQKSTPHIELAIVAEAKKTGYGRVRIARILKEKDINLKPSTVRYVLGRLGVSPKYKRSKYRRRNRFYDFENLSFDSL